MKSLVVYTSQYGNTEKVAQAVAGSIGAQVQLASTTDPRFLGGLELLVVGSPTQGGRPTVEMQQFLNSIPDGALKNIKIAAFDTRFLEQDLNFALKLLVKTIGYAAAKIAKDLKAKGGKLIVPPEGFIVNNTKGPLAPGEVERAKIWLQKIL